MPQKFVSFHAENRAALLGVAQLRLGNWADAEDAVSEAFERAWARYTRTGDLSIAWTYRTLRNLIGNEYQRARSQAAREELLRALRPTVETADSPVLDMVVPAMMALRYSDREVLYMAYWDCLGAHQICVLLGCSEAAARVRLHRARKRFKKQLELTMGEDDR